MEGLDDFILFNAREDVRKENDTDYCIIFESLLYGDSQDDKRGF